MVAGEAVLAVVAAASEVYNVVAVAVRTAFFDVRGGEEAVAAAFAAVASLAVAAADCGWCLYLVVAAENWRNTH